MSGEEPFTPAEEKALREAWALIGAWETTEAADELEYECPLCDGQGTTGGFRLDAVNVTPATLGGYGIGEGLVAAELVAMSTGRLLATLDAERELRDQLLAALKQVLASASPHPVEHPRMTAAWKVARAAVERVAVGDGSK